MNEKVERKRLKVYLEPNSNATVPPVTQWRRKRRRARRFDDQRQQQSEAGGNDNVNVNRNNGRHFQEAGPTTSHSSLPEMQVDLQDQEPSVDSPTWSPPTDSSGDDTHAEIVAGNGRDPPQLTATQVDPSFSSGFIVDEDSISEAEQQQTVDLPPLSPSTDFAGDDDTDAEIVAGRDSPRFTRVRVDPRLESDPDEDEDQLQEAEQELRVGSPTWSPSTDSSGNDTDAEIGADREDQNRNGPDNRVNSSDDETEEEEEEEDDDGDHANFDETLNSPLFEGSDISKAEALLMVLSFVMRHCLSDAAVSHLFELLNVLIGKFIFKSTKSILRHIFCNNIFKLGFHFYCLSCFSFVRSFNSVSDENISCPQCNTACVVSDLSQSNFFVTANLASQVKSLFERADISPHLTYRDTRHKQHEANIEDIFDGEIYKRMRADGEILGNDCNFSYMFNSDGMPVFKSSKYSLWPIYIMINELPPKLRFDNLILAGVWFGKVEPKMEVFLEKFTTEANKLSEDGVYWKRGDELIHSKLFGLCCCADAPARSAMQNSIRFNGYSGCGLCYHPGKLVDRVVKYPVDVCDYSDRTDDEMLNDMMQSFQEKHTVRGVKGPSALINLLHFPICWGFPPDFMHCLLLGVARQLSELWFSSEAVNQFYIGSQRLMSIINGRMKAIKPPSVVVRAPRPVSERKYWKASEWYTWLIFYSVPCLKGILPTLYWEHLIILVEASYLLLQKSVSMSDIERSDMLMFHFVCRCQLLYGSSAMTFNVHSLTHLSKCVRLWGPLWTHSCFSFEAANWRIKRQLQGNRGVIMQVVKKFLTLQMLPLFIEHEYISPRVKAFTRKILNSKRKGIVGVHGVDILGSGCSRYCTAQERDALLAVGYMIDEDTSVLVYTRLRKNGMLFCTAGYRTGTMTRNNRLVAFADDKVGDLLSVFLLNDQCVMIVKWLVLEEEVAFADDEANSKLSHLKVCTGYGDVSAVHAEEAVGNCVSMNVDGVQYIGFFPNYVALN
ncbi:uncharacterized protein [Diadema antillarum]|uniref:uncharacterized protein n=1 Tax=Diadema antillarum TaxID=105358 RepID=UPI003A87B2EE